MYIPNEGGLGFQNLRAWNLSLLAKRIMFVQAKEDAFWIKWVHHAYRKHTNIWSWEVAHTNSPLIKWLLQIWDLILLAVRGSGATGHVSRLVCFG